ncbi:hypothetical protein RchiOBHm_Chr2g0110921 [Rosa chinensis]|uniref:Uncharacterized protein n=1 Tax=Rosa chinensis TaxID=74649 RepID=A0A2P6RPU7_ROSCH|nr:hypothetical protein RchiOBHm_Chr2g0110921 [Rosa chinensis]
MDTSTSSIYWSLLPYYVEIHAIFPHLFSSLLNFIGLHFIWIIILLHPPWHVDKQWEHLLPSEWVQVFRFGTKDGKPVNKLTKKHIDVLEPFFGNTSIQIYDKKEFADSGQPIHEAVVNLDDVTICLPQVHFISSSSDGYRDVLKLADNFGSLSPTYLCKI